MPLECRLTDCRLWKQEDQGCHGRGWWPMVRLKGYEPEPGKPMEAKHRCGTYQPLGMTETFLWPFTREDAKAEGGGAIVGAGRMPEGTKGRELWIEHDPNWPEGYE